MKGWELVDEAGGGAPVAGFDVITLDTEGRIRSVQLPGPGAIGGVLNHGARLAGRALDAGG